MCIEFLSIAFPILLVFIVCLAIWYWRYAFMLSVLITRQIANMLCALMICTSKIYSYSMPMCFGKGGMPTSVEISGMPRPYVYICYLIVLNE